MSELARVEGLQIRFPGTGAPAVDDVSLVIHSGEIVALVGESGSGKSLTARALLGLLPAAARTVGEVTLIGSAGSPTAVPAARSRAWSGIRGLHAGLVPQDALGGLDPLRRVEHEVGDALRLHGLARGQARRERVLGALAHVGMPDPERHLHERSDQLSGGLRQRALLASALIADPTVVIADEPTTALDASHRGRVLAELRRRANAGAGVLLISHDLQSVRGVADRVLVMRAGRIVEQGDPARVFAAPEHPFTRELLAAAPVGVPRGVRLLGAERHGAAAADPAQLDPARPEPVRSAATCPEPAPMASSTGTPRIELHGVTAAFGRGETARAVLDDVSFAVRRGESVGLVGESGSGKTTLLRIALGPHRPDAGTVLVDGIDRATADRRIRRELRRRIAFVPQDPLDAFPVGASGSAVLHDALRAAGTDRRQRGERTLTLSDEVGLTAAELLRPAATLSGGQRQRLAIARALARDPLLLLLDEPVSALDITVQARVLDLLDDLQERRGTSYLLVSHDDDVIRHMSDRVLRLADGRLRPE
ncbi:putative ABC transporter ATP-binding protein YejF [Leucobacter soli]|uniref:ABC transporter ATP-binding protein YejF n=2 Tax=Leucobacter soli TaxID=2812850 RepID=A0A916NNR2_9MICO|nr:ATP-binding cassette domain-containing protein [Leucobacter soli]CAG7609665.1 putative ABC transporter ATP-binding protein YejF [Leucobacter soli]